MLLSFKLEKIPNIEMIGQSACSSNWKLNERTIPCYEFILQQYGKVTFLIEDKSYTLTKGDFLLIPPNTIHSGQAFDNNTSKFFFVHFYIEEGTVFISENNFINHIKSLKEIAKNEKTAYYFILPETHIENIYIPFFGNVGSYENEVFTLFEKSLAERNTLNLNSKVMISLFFSQILVILTRLVIDNFNINILLHCEGSMPRLVVEAVLYIHENYREKISVEGISRRFGISPQYLIKLFNKNVGVSPLQYINKFRISKAKELIRNSFMTLKEITYEIGLENPEYFSRLFKSIEGVSPSTIRAGLNSKSDS